jgi:hypothetical protein
MYRAQHHQDRSQHDRHGREDGETQPENKINDAPEEGADKHYGERQAREPSEVSRYLHGGNDGSPFPFRETGIEHRQGHDRGRGIPRDFDVYQLIAKIGGKYAPHFIRGRERSVEFRPQCDGGRSPPSSIKACSSRNQPNRLRSFFAFLASAASLLRFV